MSLLIIIMPKKKKIIKNVTGEEVDLEEIIEIQGVNTIDFPKEPEPKIEPEPEKQTIKEIAIEKDTVEEEEEEFIPIPLDTCISLYGAVMEIAHSFKHKVTKPLSREDCERQGKLISGILDRYKISFEGIDLAVLGIGIVKDWKKMTVEEENIEEVLQDNEDTKEHKTK